MAIRRQSSSSQQFSAGRKTSQTQKKHLTTRTSVREPTKETLSTDNTMKKSRSSIVVPTVLKAPPQTIRGGGGVTGARIGSNSNHSRSAITKLYFRMLIAATCSVAFLSVLRNVTYLQRLMETEAEIGEVAFPIDTSMSNRKLPDLFPSLFEKTMSADQVFQRMLTDSDIAWEDCSRSGMVTSSTLFNQANVSDFKKGTSLGNSTSARLRGSYRHDRNKLGFRERFGFREALSKHPSSSLAASHGDHHSVCDRLGLYFYPPSTACHVQSYSIVAVSYETTSFHTVLINVMSWLTYQYMEEIILVLPLARKDILRRDPQYGDRLWGWHTDPHHPVNLVFVEETDDDGRKSLFWNLEIQHEAVLLLHADVDDIEINDRGMTVGFELWRQFSNQVIASAGSPLLIRQEDSGVKLNMERYNSTQKVGVCPNQVVHENGDISVGLSVPSFHGTFVHRSLLCLVQHPWTRRILPPIESARIRTTHPPVPNAVHSAVMILLVQLSGHGPRWYPHYVFSERQAAEKMMKKRTTKRKTSGQEDSSNERGSRRLSEEEMYNDESTIVLTEHEEMLTSLIGYFGTYPSDTTPWYTDPAHAATPTSMQAMNRIDEQAKVALQGAMHSESCGPVQKTDLVFSVK